MRKTETDVVNDPGLACPVRSGWHDLGTLISENVTALHARKRTVFVGIDGYLGTDWSRLQKLLRSDLRRELPEVDVIDMHSCELTLPEQERAIAACLPDHEPVFGKIYHGRIEDFFDRQKIADLAQRFAVLRRSGRKRVIICYGNGALQSELVRNYDLTLYLDCTREEVLKRNREWTARSGQTQSISPRRIYYVDFPVNDRHRRKVVRKLDFYVDGTNADAPKSLSASTLRAIVTELASMPLRIKPLYESGVWGGQWLKRKRHLPESMPNCAYGFEIIAPEQSLVVKVGTERIELSFNLLMEIDAAGIVGKSAVLRFGFELPIRFAFDDTWEGGNLSVQVHPTTRYMRDTFKERMHQAEMYYVFDAQPGAVSHLGVKSGISVDDFRRAAEQSERSRTPFDHTRFVNTVPARKGNILLIPPGTVHGAGANELILEISSTPYRYTFKIYDYCRPNLDGAFRPIHLQHAFNVIKFYRDTGWVRQNLVPEPALVEQGSTNESHWKRFVLADRREFHHVVHRVEFDRSYRCATEGKFHILNLVEGEVVQVVTHGSTPSEPERARFMKHSETVLIPAGAAAFEVRNESPSPCKIVMAYLRR